MIFNWGSSQRDRFERLAESSFGSIFGTAMRLTRDSSEAEDLTQEALVRAYEAFDRFDGRNFRAWILRILTNLYINRYRKQSRIGSQASLDEENAIEPAAPAEETPDRQIFDHLLGAEVEAALSKVPETFRLAVILSDLEGLSYDEIAEVTEVPVGTVRSRIARGRTILRRELLAYAREQGYIKTGLTGYEEEDE
jgi:RNA polymerase sigma-70 factor (ECF subfamily)